MGTAQSGLKLGPPEGGSGVRKWHAKSIGGVGLAQKLFTEPPTNGAGLRAPRQAPLQRRTYP